VQLGTLDLTLTSTGPLPNFVPEVAILDIPFLFRDYAHARAVLDGPIGQEMLQKFPPKGMVALAWAENGFRHMTNSKRPVNAPDDLKGLKMRTMENPITSRPTSSSASCPRRWHSPRCSPRCSRVRSTGRRTRCR
jgi:TRAP-type C4-dicarboxylate transport system substrate-binding protein